VSTSICRRSRIASSSNTRDQYEEERLILSIQVAPHFGEPLGQGGAGPVLQDGRQFAPDPLQALDRGREFGVDGAQGALGVVVGRADRLDLGKGYAQLGQPGDLQEAHQVSHLVLLVSVTEPFGLLEQPQLVVITHRLYSRAGQLGQLAVLQATGGLLSVAPAGVLACTQ
jgi:hypothetical protein